MQDYLLDPFLFGNKYNLVNGDNPWGKYISSDPTNDNKQKHYKGVTLHLPSRI
jgi:hypothetical protein